MTFLRNNWNMCFVAQKWSFHCHLPFEDYLGTMWSTTIIKSQKAHSLASYFLPETFNHRYRNASYDIFNAQSFFGVFWSCGRVLPNLLVFIRCQFLFNNREWEEREGVGSGGGLDMDEAYR